MPYLRALPTLSGDNSVISTRQPLFVFREGIDIESQSSMNRSTYQYQPLHQPLDIRLLYLQPGGGNYPLRCFIKHVNLNEAKSYSAISYVWGDPKTSAELLIGNECTLRITPSLSQALGDIRGKYCQTREQALWADGVCINQEDQLERTRQVSIMNAIYRHANRVLTYTGPETTEIGYALDIMKELIQVIRSRENGNGNKLLIPLDTDPRWDCLHSFFQQPWAKRVWIVQECLLSQAPPVVLCGTREICWHLIFDVVQLAHDNYLPSSSGTATMI